MDYTALKAELDAGHPDTGAYDADNQIAADQINAVNRTVNRSPVTGDEMYNVTDSAEFDALTDAKKDRWVMFTRSTVIDLQAGPNQAMVNHIFGNPSASRTAMIALSTETVSRATELGLGFVKAGHVQDARAI